MEAIEMDRRWQLVLDCLDCEEAPFGKGTLVRFRALLMSKSFDRRLVEKTIEMAQKHGGYNPRSLRVALDSSPLWGAARVEDTYNLLGHALRKALEVIAQNYQQDLTTVAASAGGRHRDRNQPESSFGFRLGWATISQSRPIYNITSIKLSRVLGWAKNWFGWQNNQSSQQKP